MDTIYDLMSFFLMILTFWALVGFLIITFGLLVIDVLKTIYYQILQSFTSDVLDRYFSEDQISKVREYRVPWVTIIAQILIISAILTLFILVALVTIVTF
jgi:hypothetical protein